MTAPFVIWSVALYEVKILLRAWSFRIFALIGLVILVIMNIAFATKVGQAPYFFYSLAGSLPMMNIKLLTVYQGIIAAFLASDFIKRDRSHDSTEVIFMRPMSNADYVLGKTTGILFVFAILN
ncbi:MAG: xanthan lyase, partial [candidate division Zixibacteria bacterium]|nr:xanthan lyase [candidate division Zixibacteria bacterium]